MLFFHYQAWIQVPNTSFSICLNRGNIPRQEEPKYLNMSLKKKSSFNGSSFHMISKSTKDSSRSTVSSIS